MQIKKYFAKETAVKSGIRLELNFNEYQRQFRVGAATGVKTPSKRKAVCLISSEQNR
ncbi:MAG: hypothetical protein NTV43_09610 [Methylococcales bacterium]|nr:hypothetical protein [Methylococcales bacterium]